MYKNTILFLILFLFHSFSYGKPELLFSEQQAVTKKTFMGQTSENQETLEERKNISNKESSSLNIKAEVGGGYIYGTFSALLEFQTSVIQSRKLKWLIQAGAGTVTAPFAGGVSPYFPIDTGLRYDFHPFNISIRGGAHIVIRSKTHQHQTISGKETEFLFKGILSMGWNIGYNIHVELAGGIFEISPFLGLSVGFPLMKW